MIRTTSVDLAMAVAIGVTSVGACTAATGHVTGGDPRYEAGSSACVAAPGTAGPHTWTDLYNNYFGPMGKANCGNTNGNPACHVPQSQWPMGNMPSSVAISGFVCDGTKDGCYMGITTIFQGSSPIAVTVPPGGASDATTTQLYYWLRKTFVGDAGSALCPPLTPMPRIEPGVANLSSYTFSGDDMATISAWIQEGAQNN